MRAYAHFKYSGRNADKVLAKLMRAKLEVYDVKYTSSSDLVFKCAFKDEHKIFAIFDSAWYNIKRTHYSGGLYPALYLWRRKGAAIGLALFLILTIISGMFVFAVEVNGSGVYEEQVRSVLENSGAKPFALFSKIDKKQIESKISALEGVSFVTYTRKGNRVIIDVRLMGEDAKPQKREVKNLEATKYGKILSLIVLRGTALVSVGDEVSEGQVLVGAYHTAADGTTSPTFVIAEIEIEVLARVEFETESESDAAENAARAYAKFVIGDADYKSVTAARREGGYTVDCVYIEHISGG